MQNNNNNYTKNTFTLTTLKYMYVGWCVCINKWKRILRKIFFIQFHFNSDSMKLKVKIITNVYKQQKKWLSVVKIWKCMTTSKKKNI